MVSMLCKYVYEASINRLWKKYSFSLLIKKALRVNFITENHLQKLDRIVLCYNT
jgi:hypothetical protein